MIAVAPEDQDGHTANSEDQDELVSPVQLRAIELMASGTPVSEVAEQIGVHRSTLWRWRMEDVEFQKLFRLVQYEQQAAYLKSRRELIRLAVTTLTDRLKGGTEGGLALRFLEKAGVFDLPDVDPEPELIPRAKRKQKSFDTWAEAVYEVWAQEQEEERLRAQSGGDG